MLTIGITGGIGAGKSTVASIIEHMGYPVFYSDREAAKLMNFNPEIRAFLQELTGEDMHNEEGLDRKKLAGYLFSNPTIMERVNAFVHPMVRKSWEEWVSNQRAKYLFNEAAILIETGSFKNYDKIILVTAPMELRIQRVIERDKSTKEEVIKRINNQWSDEQKLPFADRIIENNGSPLLIQIESALSEMND